MLIRRPVGIVRQEIRGNFNPVEKSHTSFQAAVCPVQLKLEPMFGLTVWLQGNF